VAAALFFLLFCFELGKGQPSHHSLCGGIRRVADDPMTSTYRYIMDYVKLKMYQVELAVGSYLFSSTEKRVFCS
jgi:hypothetical protein